MKVLLTCFFFALPLISCNCPSEAYEWQGKCFFFIADFLEFPDAEINCQSLGGHLASVHDGFTNAVINNQANKHFTQYPSSWFWIGLNSIKYPQNLTWTDGTPFDFDDWNPTTDSKNITTNKCVDVSQYTGTWGLESCFVKRPSVCHRDSSSYVNSSAGTTSFSPHSTLTTSITVTPGRCGGNFTYYNKTNSCYGAFFNVDVFKSWDEAEYLCKSLGGYLPSAHSLEEFNFLRNLNENVYDSANANWVGLYSDDYGNTFKWSDGSKTDFLPWYPGIGPNKNLKRSCVYLGLGETNIWNTDCLGPEKLGLPTLCQIKL